jgi:hypothetical protein
VPPEEPTSSPVATPTRADRHVVVRNDVASRLEFEDKDADGQQDLLAGARLEVRGLRLVPGGPMGQSVLTHFLSQEGRQCPMP